jgi:ribosomal protein L37AE/L43A
MNQGSNSQSNKPQTKTCPNCGNQLGISQDGTHLICTNCGTSMPLGAFIKQDQAEFSDFNRMKENSTPLEIDLEKEVDLPNFVSNDHNICKCNKCGAETIIKKERTITNCVFCGSLNTLAPSQTLGIKPQLVIPFEIDGTNAKKIIMEWKKNLMWVPRKFKTQLVKNLSKYAVYLPYWSFNADTHSEYKGVRGDYYYTLDAHTSSLIPQRRTNKTNVSGQFHLSFNNFLSYGSNNANYALLEKIESFNLERAVEFNHTYLNKHLAEKYYIGIEFGWSNALVTLKKTLVTEVKKQIGGNVIPDLIVTPSYALHSFKLIYLPFYVIGYTNQEEKYQIIVNGQNGKISGSYPISSLKIFLFILLFVGIIALIVIMIRNFAFDVTN